MKILESLNIIATQAARVRKAGNLAQALTTLTALGILKPEQVMLALPPEARELEGSSLEFLLAVMDDQALRTVEGLIRRSMNRARARK